MNSRGWVSRQVLFGLFVCCLSLAVGCTRSSNLPPAILRACPSPPHVIASGGKLKLILPNGPNNDWVKHMLDETSKQAAKAGLADLKTIVLAGSDLEMRFWLTSIDGYRGIIFKRSNSQWSATQLEYMDYRGVLNPIQSYPDPDIGWDGFWEKLVSQGILEFPDGGCFQDYQPMFDGVTFIIEVNLQGTYRIYHYSNPRLQTADLGVRDPQAIEAAKRMYSIARLILDMSPPRRLDK